MAKTFQSLKSRIDLSALIEINIWKIFIAPFNSRCTSGIFWKETLKMWPDSIKPIIRKKVWLIHFLLSWHLMAAKKEKTYFYNNILSCKGKFVNKLLFLESFFSHYFLQWIFSPFISNLFQLIFMFNLR